VKGRGAEIGKRGEVVKRDKKHDEVFGKKPSCQLYHTAILLTNGYLKGGCHELVTLGPPPHICCVAAQFLAIQVKSDKKLKIHTNTCI
jgi:hypothetical protein